MRGAEFHGNTRHDSQPAYPVYMYNNLEVHVNLYEGKSDQRGEEL